MEQGERWSQRRAPEAAQVLLSLAVAVVVSIISLAVFSGEPWRGVYYFFAGPFLNAFYFGNLLNAAVPLALAGLGMALSFRASVFNLGGEGQIYAGALAGTLVCLFLPDFPGLPGAFLSLAAAAAAGGILAGLSGLFRMLWDADELITSYLISTCLLLFIDYLVAGPLYDPAFNLIAGREIPPQYHLVRLLKPSYLNTGCFIALAVVAAGSFFLFRTHRGFELRICGLNRDFARYGGIPTPLYLVLPMVMSGALHGLAGGLLIMGTHHRLIQGFSAGVGWNGIAVALIARNHPLGVAASALFYAALEAGAKAAMLHTEVTFEVAALIQASVLFLITVRMSRRRS